MTLFAEFFVPVTSYPLGERLEDFPDVSVVVERTVPTDDPTHYVWVAGEDRERFVTALGEDGRLDSLTEIDDTGDRTLLRVEWADLEAPVFGLLEDAGASVVGVHGTREGWTLQTRFPEEDALTAFYEACGDQSIPVELRQIYEPNGLTGGDEYGMTGMQVETLVTAFEDGYFEVPRQVTLTDLAEELGISEQAVSERLRRGLASLLTATAFDDTTLDSGTNGETG